jgi:hypothetical protein
MGETSGAETADTSEEPAFSGVRVSRSLVFCAMFCRSLIVTFHIKHTYNLEAKIWLSRTTDK